MAPPLRTLVGTWEVVSSHTLFIPESDSAVFDAFPGDSFVVTVKFDNSPAEGEATPKPVIEVRPTGKSEAEVILRRWLSPMDMSTTAPFVLAMSEDGRDVAMHCSARKIGAAYLAFFQFMVASPK